MKNSLLVLSLTLCSCGAIEKEINNQIAQPDLRPAPFFDATLMPYLNRFMLGAHSYGIKPVNPDFQELSFQDDNVFDSVVDGEFVLGECKFHDYGRRDSTGITGDYQRWSIFIKASTWGSLGPCERQALVSHEAGHCFLNLSHIDDVDNLMYPIVSVLEDGPTCPDFMAKEKAMFMFYKEAHL